MPAVLWGEGMKNYRKTRCFSQFSILIIKWQRPGIDDSNEMNQYIARMSIHKAVRELEIVSIIRRYALSSEIYRCTMENSILMRFTLILSHRSYFQ